MQGDITPKQKYAFIKSITDDNFEAFERMVEQHPQLLTTILNSKKQIALHIAAQNGRTRFVEYYAENFDSQINCQDGDGCTALHYVIRKNYGDIIKILLNKHADLSIKDSEGKKAYFSMKSTATIDTFLSLGLSVDHTINGETALSHFSPHPGFNNLSIYLLEKGANPDFVSENYTPLSKSMEFGNPELSKYLIEHYASKIDFTRKIPINGSRPDFTYLHLAAASGRDNDTELVEAMNKIYNRNINIRTITGITPLMMAVKHEKYNNMKKLIELGADVYATTDNGETVLHFAAASHGYYDNSCIIDLITRYNLDVNANACNESEGISGTPLTYAIRFARSAKVINLLIDQFRAKVSRHDLGVLLISRIQDEDVTKAVISKAGDVLNSKDENGQTPIFGAIHFTTDIIEQMIKYGADPTIRDDFGNDVLSYLIARGAETHVLKLLKCAGKRLIKAETDDHCSYLNLAIRLNMPRIVEALIKVGANVDKVSTTNTPYIRQARLLEACPLELALRINSVEITRMLLKAGANRNILISDITVIDFASRAICSLPMLKLLVEEFNFDVNQRSDKGFTTAFAIPKLGLPETIDETSIVGYLLSKDLDIGISNEFGAYPILEYIIRRTDQKSVNLFRKHFEYLFSKIRSDGDGPLLKLLILSAMITANYDEDFIIDRIKAHQNDIDVIKARNKKGASILQFAVNMGKNKIAKFVLDKGISFNDSNEVEQTESYGIMSAFARAVCADNFELVKIMLEKDPMSIKDKVNGNMLLEHVLHHGSFEMFKFLVNNSNPEYSEVNGAFGKQLISIARQRVKSLEQCNSFSQARKFNDIIEFLISKGVPIH